MREMSSVTALHVTFDHCYLTRPELDRCVEQNYIPDTEIFCIGTEKKRTNESSSCSCMIGPFSNNSLAMGVLVGPFFLLFALVTGNSTGHGACTSRRAATSLSGS